MYSALLVELLGQLVVGHSSNRVEVFHHLMKKIVRMHSLLQFQCSGTVWQENLALVSLLYVSQRKSIQTKNNRRVAHP